MLLQTCISINGMFSYSRIGNVMPVKFTARFVRIYILAVCLLFAGCLSEQLPPGVVATVNGHPITLRMVEARHDLDGTALLIAQNPSVELLQQQYGSILAELIVQELAAQELERLGIGVTDEDVRQAVAEIRADYPDDTFEETLFGENIDETMWLDLMRYSVVMLRFSEQVLRPMVTIEPGEVEKYYLERAPEFFIPSRSSVLIVTSREKNRLEEARERLARGNPIQDIPDVHLQRTLIRDSLVPEVWSESLTRLEAGKATQILEVNGMFQCVMLERRIPARRMSPVEAYPHIERALVESKLASLFAGWLEAASAEAHLAVSPPLHQGMESMDLHDLTPEGEPRNSEPILPGEDDEFGDAPLAKISSGNGG